MAPTHFYPLLVGPGKGPTEAQASTTIKKHLTNPARFAVWPTANPPTDHPPPPDAARPLVQWQLKKCPERLAVTSRGNGTTASEGEAPPKNTDCGHVLCCQLKCNFDNRGDLKVRYEGMAVGPNTLHSSGTAPLTPPPHDGMVPLFDYVCGVGPNASDLAYGPAGIKKKEKK